jgi:hypothetical protein
MLFAQLTGAADPPSALHGGEERLVKRVATAIDSGGAGNPSGDEKR